MKLFRSLSLLLTIFISVTRAFSQNPAQHREIIWNESGINEIPSFKGADLNYAENNGPFPFKQERFVASSTNDKLEITNQSYQLLQGFETFKKNLTSANLSSTQYFISGISIEGSVPYSYYKVLPFKIQNGSVYKLISYDIVQIAGKSAGGISINSKRGAPSPSVLATGQWYKIAVTSDGIYKLDAAFLRNLGIDLSQVNPKTLKIYGTHGGMLPEPNKISRPADLPENSIEVSGENDGVFDESDFVLFYAQGPDKWLFDKPSKAFSHQKNIYADKTVYFITFGGVNGKRIQTIPDNTGLSADHVVSSFDDHIFHESENENICGFGRVYLGEKFDQTTTYSFTETFPNIDLSNPVKMNIMAGGKAPTSSIISCLANGTSFMSLQIQGKTNADLCFQPSGLGIGLFNATSDNINLSFVYNKPYSQSQAYLDYYELFAKRLLKVTSSAMTFTEIESYSYNISEYRLSGYNNNYRVWDISDPMNVKIQAVSDQGGTGVFKSATLNTLKQYISFENNFSVPIAEGVQENQDLHSMTNVDYIIITHSDFTDQALRLADYHRTNSGLRVEVVNVNKIYTEFSSGTQDVSAIRDFLRNVYYNVPNPADRLKYALLFGDASYDYKGKLTSVPNTNFIPVYESSTYYVQNQTAFCTDDFFGYLDSLDGRLSFSNEEYLEIAVGRLPVASSGEAKDVVDKIVNYKNQVTLGDWRNRLTFIADDLDVPGTPPWETSFVYDIERYGRGIADFHPNFNVSKIYLDAYKEETNGGSQRYPEAREAIKRSIQDGSLIVNYIGHGGEEYLASEKVLDIPMINNFTNNDKLPLFFTATCEFARFDDPKRKSAGEILFTRQGGGAVAMFTTVRVVTSFENTNLTNNFWDNAIFKKINNKWPTLGDVYKATKNRPHSINDLSFAFFGDPALVLNYPEIFAKIDSVNGRSIINNKDTFKALEKVRLSGHIEDVSGTLVTSYNGELEPTIYDKTGNYSTLGNGIVAYKIPFTLRENILYRGKASITSGKFGFEFVVPKDILYNYGKGKVSLYAQNGTRLDAAGMNDSILIGGTAGNIANDTKGPEIELYIDDYNFIAGGLTDQTPLFLARISDENGINTAGNGIGRELTAILDKGTPDEKTFKLNNYYEAKLNSYKEGDIKYQLEGLADGKHTISLKVWDAYNNSSEATIEFLVSDNKDITISHVLNYPNPFSTNTYFFFDHNKSGQNLNVMVQVMTITGKVVKTIEQDVFASESHVKSINWDGRDDFGDKLSKGVYIYKVRVKTPGGPAAEKIEKLVILN
ncbi:MAG: type IX secretion system sortase PorU [Bacteroidia bacterium]|nr:type IX secretion system sortase PorU [Bacteroidia bacterium]